MAKSVVLAEFKTANARFFVSFATLLQCLQVAIDECRVPPLDEDWMRRARAGIHGASAPERENLGID